MDPSPQGSSTYVVSSSANHLRGSARGAHALSMLLRRAGAVFSLPPFTPSLLLGQKLAKLKTHLFAHHVTDAVQLPVILFVPNIISNGTFEPANAYLYRLVVCSKNGREPGLATSPEPNFTPWRKIDKECSDYCPETLGLYTTTATSAAPRVNCDLFLFSVEVQHQHPTCSCPSRYLAFAQRTLTSRGVPVDFQHIEYYLPWTCRARTRYAATSATPRLTKKTSPS